MIIRFDKTNVIRYSDGAIGIVVDDYPSISNQLQIEFDTTAFQANDYLPILDNLNSFLGDKALNPQVVVRMPYLPYARADRQFAPNQSVPLDNFMRRLSDFDHWHFIFEDVHNVAAVERLTKDYRISNTLVDPLICMLSTFKAQNVNTGNIDFVIAPDKGAIERAKSVANLLTPDKEPVYANKVRDLNNKGHITHMELYSDQFSGVPAIQFKHVLIVDDLMDGGATFIMLAKALREYGVSKITLYVTHMIGSRGLDIFLDEDKQPIIDAIYAKNIISEYVTAKDIGDFNARAITDLLA